MDILHIDFLEGIRKDIFKLNILSHIPLEVGGIPWSNTYTLELNNNLFSFWEYVKKRYGSEGEVKNPETIVIEQKRQGMDTKGYPWKHLLKVNGSEEVILFHPNYCDLEQNIIEEENSDE